MPWVLLICKLKPRELRRDGDVMVGFEICLISLSVLRRTLRYTWTTASKQRAHSHVSKAVAHQSPRLAAVRNRVKIHDYVGPVTRGSIQAHSVPAQAGA